jgi:hypothetical protein
MSESRPRPMREPVCWGCGASNTPGSSECWLCQRRDWNRYPGVRRRRQAPPGHARRSPLSTIGGWMIGIAILGVAIALFREAPGLAVVLLVSVVPALAVTELKARGRRREGDFMSSGERLAWIVALTIAIPIVVIMALAIALFAFCLFMSLR